MNDLFGDDDNLSKYLSKTEEGSIMDGCFYFASVINFFAALIRL